MIATYDDLTPDALAALGFANPTQACHILQEMAGHDVPDRTFDTVLQSLVPALASSADPDRAVANLGRWADNVGSRASAYALLTDYSPAAQMLVTIFSASQFFADLLIKNPEYVEILTNPRIRDRGRDANALWADLTRRVSIAKTPNARRDALRRFKPPEILRIGIRDLLGYADVKSTTREISDFAEVSIRMALQICSDELGAVNPSIAVIAMGKLGGQELNYASDIDLIFVHGDSELAFNPIKLTEATRDALAKATDAGFVFRVDLRLRPEGRFGPVSRSLQSCRAYYESWAEPWERQALMKARFVAGDPQLGVDFMAMAEAFVYRPRVEEAFVASIRQNKRRLEQKIARTGEAEINVKEGIGGIRDVEFAVQLMQLVTGGTHPEVRTGNTLDALECLTASGLLTQEEADLFSESYQFLRIVEHRLQLLDELAVRSLPTQPEELRKFGRRLGYPDGPSFLADYRRHTSRVNAQFTRLFYGHDIDTSASSDISEPLGEWLEAPDDAIAQTKLRESLVRRGFSDPKSIADLLRRNIAGSEYGEISPDARVAFITLVPTLLDAATATERPQKALEGIEALGRAVPSSAALFKTLLDSPKLLPRLCQLASEGPFLWQTLLQHLEFFDLLADDEALDNSQTPAPPATLPSLATVCLRQRLKTGARDIWGLADTPHVMSELTGTAEMALASAILQARHELAYTGQFAVIGMGKLGGSELSYASDLDVMYIADTNSLLAAKKLAERIQQMLGQELPRSGFRYEIDARLRPDGRKGNLVLDLASYQNYYQNSAATWERQALLKARFVAGDAQLGDQFSDMATQIVYGSPVTDDQIGEIRSMKRRIETERLANPNDIKLRPGGMTDIEWTAQLLQLRFGLSRPRLRSANTLAALRALRDDAKITQADWEILSDTYLTLTRLRNHLFLQSGVSSNTPPALSDELLAKMATVRLVCLRVFYGE